MSERKTELKGPVRYSPLSQLHHCAVPSMGSAEQDIVRWGSSHQSTASTGEEVNSP